MNQIRLLSCLLASIFIVEMTIVDVLGQGDNGINRTSQQQTKSPTPTPTPTPTPVNHGSMNWFFISSGVLHLATLGGLIYLFLELRKISDIAKISECLLSKKIDKLERDTFSTKTELSRIDKEISDKIRGLAEQHQKSEFSLSIFQKEVKNSLSALAATIKDSSSRIQDPVSSINNQQPHSSSDYYPSENTEPAYLTDYNNRQKNFADICKSVVIDRDPDNYNLSRAGQTEEVILTEASRGNYWLFSYDGLTYVVPSQKLKIREDKLNEVKDLFDCENYQESNYDNYMLIKPALVSQQVNGTWRLKEKGKLQFG
jgi:hypothetical protein